MIETKKEQNWEVILFHLPNHEEANRGLHPGEIPFYSAESNMNKVKKYLLKGYDYVEAIWRVREQSSAYSTKGYEILTPFTYEQLFVEYEVQYGSHPIDVDDEGELVYGPSTITYTYFRENYSTIKENYQLYAELNLSQYNSLQDMIDALNDEVSGLGLGNHLDLNDDSGNNSGGNDNGGNDNGGNDNGGGIDPPTDNGDDNEPKDDDNDNNNDNGNGIF